MNSTFIFFSTGIASIILSAVASADSGTTYTLTRVIDQPDPSRSNRISWIEMTDDYLVVAAPLAGFPADAGRVFYSI